MIRKILISIFLLYSLVWFATAHIIKGNIVTAIHNSETDNVKLSYKQIKISGFPGRVQVHLTEPKIQFIDHINSKEITTDKITFVLDLSFKKANLILAKNIIQLENVEKKKLEYTVQSNDDIVTLIKFSKPVYKYLSTDSLKSMIKFLQVNNKFLSIMYADKESANIADLSFLISQVKSGRDHDILLQVGLLYSSLNDIFNFKKAAIDFSILTKVSDDENTKLATVKNLNIDHFQLTCDENAQIYLAGGLQFADSQLPKGKLTFELTNYNNVIEKLIPINLLLPKKILKIIIEQSVNIRQPAIVKGAAPKLNPQEKIKLDINFSNTGIYIGTMNLLELKLDENKDNNNQEEVEENTSEINTIKPID
ncbi:hypothetical protein [Candidatus Tisiphia endosymbiont of Nemotelus uliginosus]|uniref:hypothetical protein n=1 Tax=Candidatus Tisiphia endosymbiont of Nemotelus uliginosus TaxID=3077926 RepID=UPI0035C8C420